MNQSSASVLSTAAAALYGTSEAWMVLITASPPLLALLLDSDGTSTTNMDAAFISFTLACCNFLWRSLQTPWEVSVDVDMTADSNTDESQAAVRRDSRDTTNMWEELTDTYHQEKGALMFCKYVSVT